MCFFFQISRVTPSWAGPWECRQTSLTTILSYYEGRYDMFKILRPKRTYYFDNIVTPSAYITEFDCISKYKVTKFSNLSGIFLFYF